LTFVDPTGFDATNSEFLCWTYGECAGENGFVDIPREPEEYRRDAQKAIDDQLKRHAAECFDNPACGRKLPADAPGGLNAQRAGGTAASHGPALPTGWDILNKERTGLADWFIKALQPTAGKFGVDLSRIDIIVGTKDGRSRTYFNIINLATPGSGPASYKTTLNTILHEIGHVVQYAAVGDIIPRHNAEVRQYGTEQARYAQPLELESRGVKSLIESQLVDPRFSLDAQANRFRDLILSSDIYGLSGMYRP
jgi:hypothetical protein